MSKEQDFLLIIDGSSVLTTQFFGNLPKEIMFAKTTEEKERFFPKIMQTSKGMYTNAVYGFVRVLLKIIKEQKPTYLAVAWDVSRNTFRREIYPDYKGNRGETLVPLKEQFQLCQDVLRTMGVCQFMDERYEADDFSGSLCEKFEGEVPICILTKDNDYLQLISDRTSLWLLHSTAKKTDELYEKYGIDKNKVNAPDRTFCFNTELMVKEFGVKPSSIPSLKGIQGDSSDNIKGVPGVGETTANILIAEYETVDHLYEVIRDLNDKGKKEISEYWKTLGIKRTPINALLKTSDTELVGEKAAKLSTQLATIKKDIELPVSLESLRVHIDETKAQKKFDELEFKSLKVASFLHPMEEVVDQDGFTTVTENPFDSASELDSLFEQPQSQKEEFEGQKSETEVREKAKGTMNQMDDSLMSLQIITNRAQMMEFFSQLVSEKPAIIGLSTIIEKKQVHSITVVASAQLLANIVIDGDISIEQVNRCLEDLVEDDVTVSVFDLKRQLIAFPFAKKADMFDAALAAYLINPNINDYDYTRVAAEYAEKSLPKQAAFISKRTYAGLMNFELNDYKLAVGREAFTAYALQELLMRRLTSLGMLSLYETIEMPLIYTLFDMEQRGIKVNKEDLREYGADLTGKIKLLEKDIYRMVGEEFNINSPKQLGEILFDKLKLPFGKKKKTGYSTSADVLEKLKLEDPVIEKILEYRQLTKLKSTYADGLMDYISEDGRIHGTFNQTITATGRISSTEPNLQNIPIRMELGRQIRKVFVPEDGYVFLDADYSQIELRLLAHMSGDESLINAYRNKLDIHRLTASQVFHIPFEEVTATQRSNAKAVNFGIVYGISAFSLSEDINCSRADAQEYISHYFETYPKVKRYLDGLINRGRECGYVATLYNRLRPVPDLTNTNFLKRSAEERIAMNSPIQGTAADIIKIAMIRVNEELKNRSLKSRLLLQIHDELLVETHCSEIEEVKQLIQQEMENAAKLSVPLIAEVNQGVNWYEAK